MEELIQPMKIIPFTVAPVLLIIASQTLALEALDDTDMKAVTGQEGITIDRSYSITIDEIVYVDADGAGVPSNNPTVNASTPNVSAPQTSTAPGYIVLKDIMIGDFVDAQGNFHELRPVNVTGMKIDAVSNGVLITHGNVGEAP